MRRSNKDILIDYILTLSDKECRDAWFILQNKTLPNEEKLEFDLVKLTQQEYDKLIWMWGKVKTDRCVGILNEWLKDKDISRPLHHFRQLTGWVETKYYRLYPMDDKGLKYNQDIDTMWKAKKYIKRIPKELWDYDREVRFYVEKFGKNVLS
jgi:hypothetical protein